MVLIKIYHIEREILVNFNHWFYNDEKTMTKNSQPIHS